MVGSTFEMGPKEQMKQKGVFYKEHLLILRKPKYMQNHIKIIIIIFLKKVPA
jgi:hypothetical protein